MPEIRIRYVDEDIRPAQNLKQLLEASGRIEIDLVPPAVTIADTIPGDPPDLFLTDYALDVRQEDGTLANYKGSTLTTALRDRFPDHPIVMITRRSIVSPRKRFELLSQLRLIDDFIYKDEVPVNDKRVRIEEELVVLARGFEVLREIPESERNWDTLLDILGATREEENVLRKAAPPLYAGEAAAWSVPEISHWIRSIVLAYPGILYDPVCAATELRISRDAFLSPKVQELFGPARYSGVFAPPEDRWWKERLWEIAMHYVEDTEFAKKFATVFHKREGIELPPAVSIVRNEVPADAVCYVYHEPVMYRYTAAYKPDNRPAVMDPARVSYKAIQQSNEVQIALLDGVSDEMLERIQEMEL